MENAVVGHKRLDGRPQWFVVEIFRSDREATQAFQLRSFVNNPPGHGNYYPSQVGRFVLISSASNLNIDLAKLLPAA